jgi:hypothetical protein
MTSGENTGEHTPSTPHEATFGMKRAAEVAGISVSTIRRNRELLRQHGAVLNADGWQVPMSALIASGLMRRTTPPDQPASTPQGAEAPSEDQAQERVRELEAALDLERVKRAAAEDLIRAKDKIIETQDMALRQLMPFPGATSVPESAPSAPAEPLEAQEPERPASGQATPGRFRRAWQELRGNRAP